MILNQNEIHLWFIPIDNFLTEVDSLYPFLSKEEILKSGKFYSDNDKNKFIILRSILRRILGDYLETTPGDIRFKNNHFGKPFLHPDSETDKINFNLSHSGNYGVYAFSREKEIGIDTEKIRAVGDMNAMAKRFFSSLECETLMSLPEEKQMNSFFRCWTMKEAYVKACGKGFSLPLDKFSIDFMSETPKLLNVDWDQEDINRWQIYSLDSPEGYITSLAAEGNDHKIIYKSMNEEFTPLETLSGS